MAAAPEYLRRGGIVFGAPGRNEAVEVEEDEDTAAVRCSHSPDESVDFCPKMNTHVFTDIFQVLLSVLVQQGQVGLCFYDSEDSSLHYMSDTSDNHDLQLLDRGKQITCLLMSVSTLIYPQTYLFLISSLLKIKF